MRTVTYAIASLVMVLVSATALFAEDPGWPRQRTENGNTIVIYQPQVDDWKNFMELTWRMAFSITPQGGQPAVGVMVMKGETLVDNDSRMVVISNMQIVKTHFPSLGPAQAEQMERLLRSFELKTVAISLSRLVASVPKKGAPQGIQLKNDPPVIFVSYKPAILLDVDGKPVGSPIQNTGLQYVVNTRWPLFFDTAKSEYYLLAGEQWLRAGTPEGPWSAAKKLPAGMAKVVDDPHWANLKKFIPPPTAEPGSIVPAVYYSTVPAEIILFDGKPDFAPIQGTSLRYAMNTMSYLFLHTPSNQYYYLTAGRWFRAGSLSGPWTFATPNLPDDFARIPPDSPAAQVLASVPGTEEAKDAVLMAQIPTMAVVDPAAAAAQAKVTYAGTPQFAPIEGTSLSYATNTSEKVIRAGNLYYLCLQGVWFVSPNPQGPWQTAGSVPKEIYSIPPGSPVYNVTYVTQVTAPDGSVQASYTAGYMGAYVMGAATGAVIAAGTGYYYPPYIAVYPAYPVYYPTPYTYGAAAYHNPVTGAYGVAQTAYGPYGSATRTASYNPYTGTYARTASVSTAYGSAAAGQAYNPYTGAYAATKQGSNAYASWGSSVVSKGGQTVYTHHYSTSQGTAASVQTSSGGRAAGVSTAQGTTAAAKTASGNMYAGHDGNVYKNTGSGWEKYNDGNWTPVQKPPQQTQQQAQQRAQGQQQQTQASGASREQQSMQQAQQRSSSSERQWGDNQMQGLHQEAQNRQRGEQSGSRFNEFQRSEGGSRHWGGGGGRGRR